MSLAKALYGTTYYVPENKDTNWGPTVTAILSNLMLGLENSTSLLTATPIQCTPPAVSSITNLATLTQTSPWHRVAGNGSAVTLNGTTAITSGSKSGDVIKLTGTSDSNTVRINHGGNMKMNGDIILCDGDTVEFTWDGTYWVENRRSN